MGPHKTETLFILAYSVSSFCCFISLFSLFFSLSGQNISLFSSLLAYSDTPRAVFSLSGGILAYPEGVAYSVLHCKNTHVLIWFCATCQMFCCHSVAYSGKGIFIQIVEQKQYNFNGDPWISIYIRGYPSNFPNIHKHHGCPRISMDVHWHYVVFAPKIV